MSIPLRGKVSARMVAMPQGSTAWPPLTDTVIAPSLASSALHLERDFHFALPDFDIVPLNACAKIRKRRSSAAELELSRWKAGAWST